MATAEIVFRTRVVEVQEEVVVLRMTKLEARVICAVANHVGGSPDKSNRAQMESVVAGIRSVLPIHDDDRLLGMSLRNGSGDMRAAVRFDETHKVVER